MANNEAPVTPPPVPGVPFEKKTPEKAPVGEKVKEKEKEKKPRQGLFLSFLAMFVFLFVLFIVFLVVMLLQGGEDNPILTALGVEPALLQQLLQTLVSLIFGFLALIAFIVSLVGFFRRFTATKTELDKKKSSLILGLVSLAFFIFLIVLWLILYFYISQLQVESRATAVILTEPEVTINLSAPIDVTFDAREIDRKYIREGIVSYSWDLDGDGAFDDGNGKAIQHTYKTRGNAEGVYNVAVKVILSSGQELVIEKLLTIANVRPSLHVEYSPKILEVPVEVSFDASKSRDLDGSIISYDWDFDEDGIADEQGEKATWSFNEVKELTVTLTVMDNNGETVEEKIVLDLQKGREKEAAITARPGLSGDAPFRVTFDGSNSFIAERIQSYDWDFGDNTPLGKGRSVQHTYDDYGEYIVKLMIVGEGGSRYEVEETVLVERFKKTPTAVIEVKGQEIVNNTISGEAPLLLQFEATGSSDADGNIIEYRWDFDGDGVNEVFGEEVEYSFIEEKTYETILTVIDDDELSSTATLNVNVTIPALIVVLSVSTYSGPVPLEVTFDASASRSQEGKIISYTWNFGDGSQEVIGSAQQTHVYNEIGEYTVEVTVLSDGGIRESKEVLVVAREIELQADFTFNPQSPIVESKVFFDASPSQGQISQYYWEFGDGQISRVVKPSHSYEQIGTYKVILEIYDRKNRISRKEVEIDVGQ